MCSRNRSGFIEPEPINPKPPLFETADASFQPETQTIPAGEKRDFATYAFAFDPTDDYAYSLTTDCIMSEKFIGIGVVTGNTAGQDLVGINNQINNTDDPNKGAALM